MYNSIRTITMLYYGEICLNTCTTDAQAIFFKLPDPATPNAAKRINVNIKKNLVMDGILKRVPKPYSKIAESKETTFIYPKSNQAFVYSSNDLARLLAFEKGNNFSGYAL